MEKIKKLTDQEVIEEANKFAYRNKSSVYSETEFNVMMYYAELKLLKDGATANQLELFRKTVQETPIRGGRFNSYSGD